MHPLWICIVILLPENGNTAWAALSGLCQRRSEIRAAMALTGSHLIQPTRHSCLEGAFLVTRVMRRALVC